MPVQIKIDKSAVEAKIRMSWQKSKGPLASEILADCNEYCKMDTGLLIASSLSHSTTDPMRVDLTWNTPYAKRQYWEIRTAHKDENPMATWMWCEAAKKACLDKWNRQAEILMRSNL